MSGPEVNLNFKPRWLRGAADCSELRQAAGAIVRLSPAYPFAWLALFSARCLEFLALQFQP